MAEKFETNNFFFCWDAGMSHRHRVYPGYKEKREKNRQEATEEDKESRQSMLIQQCNLERDILPSLGFKNNFIQHNYEADDLMAHWVNRLYDKGYDIIMVTTDYDMLQCLDKCRIWFPNTKKFFTKKMMLKKYGIGPDQWAMAKAIGGCGTDEVIGIEGASDPKNEKSKALKYMRGELCKGKIYDRIKSKQGKAIIERNLPIVTVPFMEDHMKRMIWKRNEFDRKAFIKLFGRYRFISFLKDDYFKRWEKAFNIERR